MASEPLKPLPKVVADTPVKKRTPYDPTAYTLTAASTTAPKNRGNIVLDIDETFVQYVGLDDWETMKENQHKFKFIKLKETSDGGFILRPHCKTFFDFLKANCETVNLWTLSEQEYADGVKKMIETEFGIVIKYAWSEEHNEPAKALNGNNKDLNWIWYENEDTVGKFLPCNTILIDDLLQNTQNSSNYRNGIRIPAFAPLGKKLESGRTKTRIRTDEYDPSAETDTILLEVIQELRALFASPEWCKEGDLPYPITGYRIDLAVGESETTPAPAAPGKTLNLIFDIDETLTQHVTVANWDKAVPVAERAKYTVKPDTKSPTKAYVLRPGLKEFLLALKDIAASISLWTWSSKEHAEKMAEIILNLTDNQVKVKYKWGAETAQAAEDEYGANKNLKYIWENVPGFNKNNTILVDEHPMNISHAANFRNGIRLREFRVLNENGTYRDMSNDTTLSKVLAFLKSKLDANGKPIMEKVAPKKKGGPTMVPSIPFNTPGNMVVEIPPCNTEHGGRRRTYRKKRSLGRKTRARKTK